MKKTAIILLLTIVVISSFGCSDKSNLSDDCVRIHIRANSNLDCDQAVKLCVRDSVIDYLTPLLAECENTAEAKGVIENKIPELTVVANKCLSANGYEYTAEIALKREKFPYREYLDYRFSEGVYDALIISLGEGRGDNWWCVAFPPLCFIPESDDENFYYKSKILEIIEKMRG